ncbi:MAG: peptidoglycan DD-metalloendopeptidase family protein [Alphaproteobacteria bacterium]|nr:peptidoglycan DD-metalloendopeptidase family protein [Alphaproteobacteria bacterium]
MDTLEHIKNYTALHRVFRLRHRYFLTKNNKLRVRYVASSAAIVLFAATGFVGSSNTSVAFSNDAVAYAAKENLRQLEIKLASMSKSERVYEEELTRDIPKQKQDIVEPLVNIPDENENLTTAKVDYILKSDQNMRAHGSYTVQRISTPPEPKTEIVKIGTGETIGGVLQDNGISGAEAYNIVKALSKNYNPRSIKAGQAISLDLEPVDEGWSLSELKLKTDSVREVIVEKLGEGNFRSFIEEKEIILKNQIAKASIQNSLYGSAAKAGVPASVVANMIRIYSYEVDFQRDIRTGDKIEVFYQTYETQDGDFAKYGDILYANLIVGGKSNPVYRFKKDNGHYDYYTEDGTSIKQFLMRTPIDGARVSSGFGMRRHPVLGYNKMHKGMDFAASSGTPIYAAGDGVIEYIGRNGGYGNYIRIRHNGSMKTAYAHMKGFKKNLSKGSRVTQGEIIGYVGTTGRSTGPHLHYEVLKDGRQVNPNRLDLPTGEKLAAGELQKFKSVVASIKQQYAELADGMKFASNE